MCCDFHVGVRYSNKLFDCKQKCTKVTNGMLEDEIESKKNGKKDEKAKSLKNKGVEKKIKNDKKSSKDKNKKN